MNVWRKIGPADGTNGNAQRIEIQVGIVELRQRGQQEFFSITLYQDYPFGKEQLPARHVDVTLQVFAFFFLKLETAQRSAYGVIFARLPAKHNDVG